MRGRHDVVDQDVEPTLLRAHVVEHSRHLRVVCEGMPEGEAVSTVTLADENGRTMLTNLSEYPSKAIRDAVINSGMEGGMQESMDHLEQVAVSLR